MMHWISGLVIGLIALGKAQATVSESWRTYYPEAFDESELCKSLNCEPHQVCLTKGENAFCMNKDQLHELHHLKIEEGSNDLLVQLGQQPVRALHENLGRHQKEQDAYNEVHNFIHRRFKSHQTQEHKHPKRHQDNEKVCAEDELKAIGGRLLQWFTDVHKTNGGEIAPLPSHRIQCREDVAWMFQQWDYDHDGELVMRELGGLEGDRYEPCIKPFIDRCDENADDAVSLDEWCDCFLWADNLHDEPPCHAAKHKIDPHQLGAFVPRCDVDGYYRVEQCHENQCWCTDRLGREFDRSRSLGKRPDCAQYAEFEDEEDK